ncbi:transcriptional regulator [Streptomyces sp. SM12]|uniref:transcriptional regulator n=1 Tax=Streptomyces sp. SM12 TaxID=1071602 RepID=UPI00215661B2|nr:transcriptional regulator [Streptomyces sp. SM12]
MSVDEHPLRHILRVNGWSATEYLARLSPIHAQLGHGTIPLDRKRVHRWIKRGIAPSMPAQRAMARLHKIPEREITARPWPMWLALACHSDRSTTAPWTPEGTLELLDHAAAGGPVDRRGFMIGTGLAPVLAGAASATPAHAQTTGRQIGAATPALFEECLAVLRRQDDQFGSGQVHASARAQLRLITGTLRDAAYTEHTGRRLYAAAAEAARICAWTAYDSGRHALAEEFYITALRAAATADDPVVTANTLAFWSIQRYSTGDPHGAADLVTHALSLSHRIGSPRMDAMLLTRLARAHAQAGDERASHRAQDAALTEFSTAESRSPEDDPDCVYWVNLAELHMLHGSCALNLGHPKQALAQFDAAGEQYRGHDFPRAAVIYLARSAEAQIRLRDLDGAVATAHTAIAHIGGVQSARGSSTLKDLRERFADHSDAPVVRHFLLTTAA